MSDMSSLKRIYHLWMKFSEILGGIVSGFWLSVFYCSVITPVGLLWRLLGHDPLQVKWEKGRVSYREISDKLDPQHMEFPY
jgi:hypothetical protein